ARPLLQRAATESRHALVRAVARFALYRAGEAPAPTTDELLDTYLPAVRDEVLAMLVERARTEPGAYEAVRAAMMQGSHDRHAFATAVMAAVGRPDDPEAVAAYFHRMTCCGDAAMRGLSAAGAAAARAMPAIRRRCESGDPEQRRVAL